MTDAVIGPARAPGSGFFTIAAMQKAVAFVGLLGLIAFFSIFAENFAQWSNVVNILQATAVNGVLGVAATFTIFPPRLATCLAASSKKILLGTPFQRGSVFGKKWPMSSSPSAPRTASQMACIRASASE